MEHGVIRVGSHEGVDISILERLCARYGDLCHFLRGTGPTRDADANNHETDEYGDDSIHVQVPFNRLSHRLRRRRAIAARIRCRTAPPTASGGRRGLRKQLAIY